MLLKWNACCKVLFPVRGAMDPDKAEHSMKPNARSHSPTPSDLSNCKGGPTLHWGPLLRPRRRISDVELTLGVTSMEEGHPVSVLPAGLATVALSSAVPLHVVARSGEYSEYVMHLLGMLIVAPHAPLPCAQRPGSSASGSFSSGSVSLVQHRQAAPVCMLLRCSLIFNLTPDLIFFGRNSGSLDLGR